MSPAKVAAWIESADVVIAADGGLLRVLETGYIPDIVIGDFDSVTLDQVHESTVSIVDSNQDSTDCKKLLDHLHARGGDHVTLICAEGDLTDHFLDTIHNAVRTDIGVSIGLERGTAWILKGPISVDIHAEVGRRASLLPLVDMVNVQFTGTKWEVDGKDMSVQGFTSISNQVSQPQLHVSFDKGAGYLFIESEHPNWNFRHFS